MTIIEWDYNLSPSRISGLSARLQAYLDSGFKVLFMPSAGFSFDPEKSISDQVALVHEQITIAAALDVEGISHFIGPRLNENIASTSLQNAR